MKISIPSLFLILLAALPLTGFAGSGLAMSHEAHVQQTGRGEFWLVRDPQHLPGYAEWRKFTAVITKAKIANKVSQHLVPEHIVDVNNMVQMYKKCG